MMTKSDREENWRERAPLPRGSSHVGLASLGGKLYAIGGFVNVVHVGAQDIAFEYDPAKDAWRGLAPLPKGSHAFGAATVGDAAYFAGGTEICGGGTQADLMAFTLP